MPWTPRETRYLLSKASPLTPEQKDKMKAELHADPQMAHAKKKGLLSRVQQRNASK